MKKRSIEKSLLNSIPKFIKTAVVAAPLIIGAGITTARLKINYQLTKAATPCTEAIEKQLIESDLLIEKNSEQIKRWYDIICTNDDWKESCTQDFKESVERVLETYKHSPEKSGISRFCATKNSFGEEVSGIDITKYHGSKAYSFFPSAFIYNGQTDRCRTTGVDIHERTHAVTGFLHQGPNPIDIPYLLEMAAVLVCIDQENPTEENLTDDQRFSRALTIDIERLKKDSSQ